MNEQDSAAIKKLLEYLGGVLIAGALTAVARALITSTDYLTLPAILVFVVGFIIFLCGVFWHRLAPKTDTKFTSILTRIASDPRWWLLIIFGSWLYMAVTSTITGIWLNNQVVELRNDEQAIAKVLDRIVLPRHLNKQQQATISRFLQQFEPHEFAFRLSSRNEEAGEYRVDIEQALLKGGWTRSMTNPYTYADDVQEGVSISVLEPLDHSQKVPDPKSPDPSLLLQEAFGLAAVRFTGTSNGGAAVSKESITINIGPARRDSYKLELPDGNF
jgi:hypothetical protein